MMTDDDEDASSFDDNDEVENFKGNRLDFSNEDDPKIETEENLKSDSDDSVSDDLPFNRSYLLNIKFKKEKSSPIPEDQEETVITEDISSKDTQEETVITESNIETV